MASRKPINKRTKEKSKVDTLPVGIAMPGNLGTKGIAISELQGLGGLETSAVLHCKVDLSQFSQLDSISGHITKLIENYKATFDVSATTNQADIEDLIGAYIDSYVHFLVLKRTQEASGLTNRKGNVIASAYTKLPTTGMAGIKIDDRLPTAPATASIWTSISNKVWNDTYVSRLKLVSLPEAIIKLLNTLFQGSILLPDQRGMSREVMLWPNSIIELSQYTTPHTAFTTSVDYIVTKLGTDPALVRLVKQLGFEPITKFEQNYRRSINPRVVRVADPTLVTMLQNDRS